LEFEFNSDGHLRYANGSAYRRDATIRKEVRVGRGVLAEVQQMVEDSRILRHDDSKWPEPSEAGRQELEVVLGRDHVTFSVSGSSFPRLCAQSSGAEVGCSPAARVRTMQCRRSAIARGLQCAAMGSLSEADTCADPDGFSKLYFLGQDLKSLVLSLIAIHFKSKPIP